MRYEYDPKVARAMSAVVNAILQGEKVVRATKYLSTKLVVRAVRTRYGGKIRKDIEITLSVCPPNYVEREFIEDCRKAGEPFPVKKIQLKVLDAATKKLVRKVQ